MDSIAVIYSLSSYAHLHVQIMVIGNKDPIQKYDTKGVLEEEETEEEENSINANRSIHSSEQNIIQRLLWWM